jgi:hypothetical protein
MFDSNNKLLFETYKQDKLPETWLRTLFSEGYFKLFVPKKYGGLELSLKEGLKRIYEAGRIHGSLGWSLNLGAGAGYFWAFFEDSVAEHIFQPSDAVISGSGIATGHTVGKNVTGRWDKCSGAGYASWFTANAKKEDGRIVSFCIPREKVRISPAWDLFALKATSSYAIEIENESVPDNHFFQIGKIVNTSTSYPIYHIPFEPFARLCMLAAFLGMADCLSAHLLEEHASHDGIMSRAEELKQVSVSKYDRMLEEAERIYSGTEKQLLINVGEISRSIYGLCNDLFYQNGMRLSDESTLSHFAWRDVILGTQHFLLR